MLIRQFYTGCLSEAAYYIESNGEAAVVDPLRDIDEYLQLAAVRNAKIKYIFETHFHADFVSGHLELSQATGALIVYGPGTETGFPVHVAADGEQFILGKLTLEVLHTPGHTMESSCYLLKDEQGKDYCVFTGDTLFVGDVGRPDLVQKEQEITLADMAGMLYDSLHRKILPLADDVIIYPAHGAGSSCGKNLSTETFSTLGEQKKMNYALKAASKEEFIKEVTSGIPAPPPYFPINIQMNKQGYPSLDALLNQSLTRLSVTEFKKLMAEDTLILDTRPANEFIQSFIPTSVNIGLEGRFAEWAGSLLPFDKPLLLVTGPGKERESVIRLARVGFDKIAGYLDGGFASWQKAGEPIDMLIEVEPDELLMDAAFDNKLLVMDVRKSTEFAEGHLPQAFNLPLSEMKDPGNLALLEENQNLYVHCGSGYRSIIACSLLKRQGYHNLRNVAGGWNAIKEQKQVNIVIEKEE